MKKSVILAVCICLAGACVMEDLTRVENPRVLKNDMEAVWASVLETMAELRLPVLDMDKAAGVITTEWISFKNQDDATGYCACGTTKFPLVEVDRRGKFQISIIGLKNPKQVSVSSVFEKISQYKDIVENTPCVSTGKLEAEISSRITRKLK